MLLISLCIVRLYVNLVLYNSFLGLNLPIVHKYNSLLVRSKSSFDYLLYDLESFSIFGLYGTREQFKIKLNLGKKLLVYIKILTSPSSGTFLCGISHKTLAIVCMPSFKAFLRQKGNLVISPLIIQTPS